MIPMRIMKGTCEISTSALTLTSQPPAFQGEAGALQVQIDFTVDGSAFSPDASIEAQMYLYYPASDVMTPAQTMTISGNKATATLSAEDQATPGAPYLVIQLTDTSGGALIVSCMTPLIIRQTRADTFTDGTAPNPSDVVYVGRAPYLSPTNTWMVWDNASASYVDSGVVAIGPQGPAGEVAYSTETPKPLGDATAGTSMLAARGDHVHPMPTAEETGALPNTYKAPVTTVNGEEGDVTVSDIRTPNGRLQLLYDVNIGSYPVFDTSAGDGYEVRQTGFYYDYSKNITILYHKTGNGPISYARVYTSEDPPPTSAAMESRYSDGVNSI